MIPVRVSDYVNLRRALEEATASGQSIKYVAPRVDDIEQNSMLIAVVVCDRPLRFSQGALEKTAAWNGRRETQRETE